MSVQPLDLESIRRDSERGNRDMAPAARLLLAEVDRLREQEGRVRRFIADSDLPLGALEEVLDDEGGAPRSLTELERQHRDDIDSGDCDPTLCRVHSQPR